MKKDSKEKWTIAPRFSDIHGAGFVEAICEHGTGHHRGTHGCDGCCGSWPKEIAEQTTHEERSVPKHTDEKKECPFHDRDGEGVCTCEKSEEKGNWWDRYLIDARDQVTGYAVPSFEIRDIVAESRLRTIQDCMNTIHSVWFGGCAERFVLEKLEAMKGGE